LFVSFYVTTDLSAPIISNSNYRMARTRTRQQEHCRSSPVSNFMFPASRPVMLTTPSKATPEQGGIVVRLNFSLKNVPRQGGSYAVRQPFIESAVPSSPTDIVAGVFAC
jgi:hypothetical protein